MHSNIRQDAEARVQASIDGNIKYNEMLHNTNENRPKSNWLNSNILTDNVAVNGQLRFDPNVARTELDRQYASEEDIRAANAFKAQDDAAYSKAVENGYKGPKNNIVIPDKYKADMKAAAKVDLQATLSSLGLTGKATVDANGGLSKLEANKQIGGMDMGISKNYNPATGDNVANTLYANYGSKNWNGGVSRTEDKYGNALSKADLEYRDGNHSVSANYTTNNDNNSTNVQYKYRF